MIQKRSLFLLYIVALCLAAGPTSFAQEKPEVEALINARDFVFVAQTASPLAGKTRHLTSRYELRISPDTAVASLPYFGRAYSPSYNMTGGGIEFTSTDFDYATVRKKRKKWEILLQPHDASDIQELTLTVFENGRADLRVSSQSRQAISFSGFITKRK